MFKSAYFFLAVDLARIAHRMLAAVLVVLTLPLVILSDRATSWLIRLLSLDDPLLAYPPDRSQAFPAPQTGTPKATAFA